MPGIAASEGLSGTVGLLGAGFQPAWTAHERCVVGMEAAGWASARAPQETGRGGHLRT